MRFIARSLHTMTRTAGKTSLHAMCLGLPAVAKKMGLLTKSERDHSDAFRTRRSHVIAVTRTQIWSASATLMVERHEITNSTEPQLRLTRRSCGSSTWALEAIASRAVLALKLAQSFGWGWGWGDEKGSWGGAKRLCRLASYPLGQVIARGSLQSFCSCA